MRDSSHHSVHSTHCTDILYICTNCTNEPLCKNAKHHPAHKLSLVVHAQKRRAPAFMPITQWCIKKEPGQAAPLQCSVQKLCKSSWSHNRNIRETRTVLLACNLISAVTKLQTLGNHWHCRLCNVLSTWHLTAAALTAHTAPPLPPATAQAWLPIPGLTAHTKASGGCLLGITRGKGHFYKTSTYHIWSRLLTELETTCIRSRGAIKQ